jgi:hypothetical protein
VTCESILFDESILVRIHPYVLFEALGRTLCSHHKKYLCCNPDGVVTCDRTKAKEWEHFDTIQCRGRFAIRSYHGRYLTVSDSGQVNGCAIGIGERELFDVISLGQEKFALKAPNGRFITAEPGGQIRCNAEKLLGWEMFLIS